MKFKGTEVALLSLEISTKQARQISFDLAFRDNEGRVHATMRHTLPFDVEGSDDDVAKAAKQLIAAVLHYGQKAHFEGVELTSVREGGLSDALDRAF